VRKMDVTDKDSIFALAEELGRVDILFNCAGSVYFVLQCYLELAGLPSFARDFYGQLCLSVCLFLCLLISLKNWVASIFCSTVRGQFICQCYLEPCLF
jgi:hypothetical protein